MNVRWAPSADEVAAFDAAPWDMPGARALRRLSYATAARTAGAGTFMYGLATISIFLSLPYVDHGRHAVIAIGVIAGGTSVVLAYFLLVLRPTQFIRIIGIGTSVSLPSAGLLTSWYLIATHQQFPVAVILYLEAPVFGFYMFRRWSAWLLIAFVVLQYAVVVGWRHDSIGLAFAEWFVVSSTVAAAGIVIGGVASRAEQLAESEHEARTELADLNATLSSRVAEQVGELDRLGKMRRFLSPQIADAVVSDGSGELLDPHRRRIAVLFCDLRGFTAFTNGTEPEEVVAVLDEYYASVGTILRNHDATIGSYAGDGIMAYFGDPVPRDAPALDAVTAAAEIAGALTGLAGDWARRGYQLNYGMGVAFGYATLGVVGFDGRYDYTPLGAVVNLAARLCSAAESGQVLLDHATQAEVSASHHTIELDGLELKGFATDVRVHSLTPADVLHGSVTTLRTRRVVGGGPGISGP